ncbi:multiheme c-type cytochrome [Zavarzinia sp. CC-PAN008]|uniref:multiheme c-type cytochrome n=1 Tax=Zavarzinia sp. CC-PAN008 TaxID=3243332 RepID=UPI003F74292E
MTVAARRRRGWGRLPLLAALALAAVLGAQVAHVPSAEAQILQRPDRQRPAPSTPGAEPAVPTAPTGQAPSAAPSTPPADPNLARLNLLGDCGSCHGGEASQFRGRDPHRRLGATLATAQAREIAANLGISPNARECAQCHATSAASCASCHGSVAQAAFADHITTGGGIVPLGAPGPLGRTCVGCHTGDASKPITHRIYGAGHPRLPYELDTWMAIYPKHWRGGAGGVGLWAVGQAVAATAVLDRVANAASFAPGGKPELALFECQSCHTTMDKVAWVDDPLRSMRPGYPRIHDANLQMLRILAKAYDPALADRLERQSSAMYQASTESVQATAAAARALRSTVAQAGGLGRGGEGNLRRLLGAFVAEAESGNLVDFAAAEQATMAMGGILSALRGSMPSGEFSAASAALDSCYKAVATEAGYDPAVFRAAMQRMGQAAGIS